MGSTYGLHITRLGFADAVYGGLLSLNGVLVVLCELPITVVTQRLRPRRVMAAGYALIALGFASNAFSRSIPELALGMIMLTLGEIVAMPVAGAYVSDLAPSHMRGRYWGVQGFIWSTALIFGPTMGMVLLDRSASFLWLTCGALGLLAAVIISLKPRVFPVSKPKS
jgi:MFS family permease